MTLLTATSTGRDVIFCAMLCILLLTTLPSWSRRLREIRDLTKLGRRRQRQRQKSIALVSKTTTLHVHHAFLYISLPSLHDYDVKWPNFKFFEDGKSKATKSTISVWTRARLPLLSSNINSLLLSNWATWDSREMFWKDTESIFQRSFHGRRLCRIVSSLLVFCVVWREHEYTTSISITFVAQ